ncbi:MAG: hypothetical protein PUH70_12160 [Clostridiales bacterium]|nr:hypothetical protein [Clostridiales bacterium]MDY5514824.1 hypothetical protein [Candidatus Ventricola sp.]
MEFAIRQTVDLGCENPVLRYAQPLEYGDSCAHRWIVTVERDGAAADLSAMSAKCYVTRAAGDAERAQGVTSVTLPLETAIDAQSGTVSCVFQEGCYGGVGAFAAIMRLSDASGATVTAAKLTARLDRSTSDAVYDPEGLVPSLDALLAQIETIEAATEAANTAAANANAKAADADTATVNANRATGNANAGADGANKAAAKINGMTIDASGLSAGASPTAVLSEVDGHYHIALGIPRGATGATPQISVQVQTGEAGSEAQVSVSGTAENPVIHLTIPRGDVGDIGTLTINGKAPDSNGAVTLTMSDIDGLADAIENAGGVKTVSGVSPDTEGNVSLKAENVGALPSGATAADSSKLGGQLPAFYATAEDIAPLLYNNAGAHNAIYRGKDLGTAVTDAQWAAIAAGTFEDLYIGDYWTIGGVTYRIAAFDYYLLAGGTDTTTHHVTLVPDGSMYTHVMNDSGGTTGGYVGSKMYTTGLADAKTTINNAFGSAHILTHRQYLCNAVSDGKPSGASWYDSTVELLTEQNVYGGKVFGAVNNGSTVPALYTVDKSQYPLFAFRPDLISNRTTFWLRDVVSNSHFTHVNSLGEARYTIVTYSLGVRPAFSIC